MNYEPPIAMRFKPAHRAHLKRRAAEAGHDIEVLIVRQLIEQDMRKDLKRLKRANGKGRAA